LSSIVLMSHSAAADLARFSMKGVTGAHANCRAICTTWLLRVVEKMGFNACRVLIFLCAVGVGCSAMAAPDAALTLRERYASLGEQLRLSPFGKPLLLGSTETPTRLAGDVYAAVDYPLGVVNTGLNNPQHWCDVMLLHVNTKYCRAAVEHHPHRLYRKEDAGGTRGRIAYRLQLHRDCGNSGLFGHHAHRQGRTARHQ
jgi:hypothetical protein